MSGLEKPTIIPRKMIPPVISLLKSYVIKNKREIMTMKMDGKVSFSRVDSQ